MKFDPDEVQSQRRSPARSILSFIFIGAGVLHFIITESYMLVMPPYLPLHRELVYLSGIFEIAGGVGLLINRTRRVAGVGLILLLIAVWPANFQMLFNAQKAQMPLWNQALLWARLPLQIALIYGVWQVALREKT